MDYWIITTGISIIHQISLEPEFNQTNCCFDTAKREIIITSTPRWAKTHTDTGTHRHTYMHIHTNI